MTDRSELVTDMLQARMQSNAAIQLMLNGARMVTAGGTEGIIDVVQNMDDGPETILTVIQLLVDLAAKQEETINDLTEKWLASMDHTDKIVSIIEEHTSTED